MKSYLGSVCGSSLTTCVRFLPILDEASKQMYGFGAELVSEIGFLTDLEALIVPGFHFATTSIPTQIGRLTNLVDLNLGTSFLFLQTLAR